MDATAAVQAGKEIRAERNLRKLSRRAVAQTLGIGERTLSRLENGEVEEPRNLDVVQRYFRVGPYAPTDGDTDSDDPRLSEATFSDLLGALSACYGRDLRAARGAGTTIHAIDELPPDVLKKAQDGTIPSGRTQPFEGNSTE